MIENTFVNTVVGLSLIVLVLLAVACVYRAYKGPSIADRLLAIDLITTIIIGIILLLMLLTGPEFLVDIALAMAALTFIGTVALARYVSEGRVF